MYINVEIFDEGYLTNGHSCETTIKLYITFTRASIHQEILYSDTDRYLQLLNTAYNNCTLSSEKKYFSKR